MNGSHELLDFVKAMADADRLRIIGVLAKQPAKNSEIAGRLHMPLRDIVDHLAFFEHVDVISRKDDLYELNTARVETLAREQLRKKRPEYIPAPDLDKKSRRVLGLLPGTGRHHQTPAIPARSTPGYP